jgi:hypothetical protein
MVKETPPKFPKLPDLVEVIPDFTPTNWGTLNKRALANGLGVADTVTVDSQQKLSAIGIDGPAKLLVADLDLDHVSLTSGVSRGTLEVLRDDINRKQFLINTPLI